MGIFAPQQSGGIGFEQPVNPGAGGLGVAASVADLFAKGFSEPREPTVDERGGELWASYAETIGKPGLTLADATRGDLDGFGRVHTGYANWAYDSAENQLNASINRANTQLEIDAANEKAFWTSPEGLLANQKVAAVDDPQKQQQVYLEARTQYQNRLVDTQNLTLEIQREGVNDTRRKNVWRTEQERLAATASTMSIALTESLEMLQADPSASINLDETGITAMFPSLRGKVLRADNAAQIAAQFRSDFMRQQTAAIETQYGMNRGQLGSMDATTEAAIFKQFDTVAGWLEENLTPQAIKSRLESQGFIKLIEAGAPVNIVSSLSLAAAGNPEIQSALLGLVGNTDWASFIEGASGKEALRIAREQSSKERADAFTAFSTLARGYAGTSTDVSVYEGMPEASLSYQFAMATIGAFSNFEAEAKNNEDAPTILGRGFWSENVAKVAGNYEGAARNNPEFTPAVTNGLTGDVNTHILEINRKIPDHKLFVSANGKITVVPNEATERKIAGLEKDNENLRSGAVQLPGGKVAADAVIAGNLSTIEELRNPKIGGDTSALINELEYKWRVLGDLGEIGQSVRSIVDTEFDITGAVDVAKDAMAVLEESVKPGEVKTDTLQPAPAGTEAVSVAGVSVTVNLGMKPILSGYEGTSKMVLEGADVHMEELIAGPFATLQTAFGKDLVINDAIAKDGTSRETQTPNSRHFHGDAIDISTAGMSDADKLRLVDLAIEAGFQGFGFGENILHIDLGHRRSWAYGNDTFGGKPVSELQALVNGSSVPRPVSEGGPKLSGEATAGDESDPGEGPVTNFSLPKTSSAAPSTPTEAQGQETATLVEAGVFTRPAGGEPTKPVPPALEKMTPAELQGLIDYVKSLGG